MRRLQAHKHEHSHSTPPHHSTWRGWGDTGQTDGGGAWGSREEQYTRWRTKATLGCFLSLSLRPLLPLRPDTVIGLGQGDQRRLPTVTPGDTGPLSRGQESEGAQGENPTFTAETPCVHHECLAWESTGSEVATGGLQDRPPGGGGTGSPGPSHPSFLRKALELTPPGPERHGAVTRALGTTPAAPWRK